MILQRFGKLLPRIHQLRLLEVFSRLTAVRKQQLQSNGGNEKKDRRTQSRERGKQIKSTENVVMINNCRVRLK